MAGPNDRRLANAPDRAVTTVDGVTVTGQAEMADETRPCPACGATLRPDETHWSLFPTPMGGYVCPRLVKLAMTELDSDSVVAIGLDGTGRDGDPRFPYTVAKLTTAERRRLLAVRETEFAAGHSADLAESIEALRASLPEKPFTVSWSIDVDGVDARDAAMQAWAMLMDATLGVGLATVLVVRKDEAMAGAFDMASDPPRKVKV